MGGEDNGMLLTQLLYKVAYLYYLLGVKTHGRLVKNQNLGVAYKRLSDAHTLFITLGKVLYESVFYVA